MKKESEKRELEVIQGDFGNGDPLVQKNFAEAIERIKSSTDGKIKSFAVVVVYGNNCVGTAYDEGESFHQLIGGVRNLENRMFRELYEGEES